MPQFAANLSMMYTEVEFLDRFAAAAADGFRAVEYLFPYAFDRAELARRLKANGLRQVLFNGPPGDWDRGERGLACLPTRVTEFRRGVLDQAFVYAEALSCPRVHLMAGLVPDGADRSALRETYVENLAWAAEQARGHGIDILIEPINTRDVPGYFLNRQDHAHEIVREIGAPNLKVQMDLYHCQIVEGDVAMKIRKYLADPAHRGRVGHFQIAGVPDRNEPDRGELHHPYLFALLDELGWDGHVGCEYRPKAGTSAGLGWFQPYRSQQKD
jgi:2-dehydrotetronate isomerase